MTRERRGDRLRLISAAAAVAGALLFVWSLRTAGVGSVFDGMRRLGLGFVVIWALGGVRFLVRAIAWRWSFDRSVPSLASAFGTQLAGDAIGNVTPFGLLISEPSKVVRLRNSVPPADAIPAIAIENLFYGASVAAMMLIGAGALLLAFPVPSSVRVASFAVLGVMAASAVTVVWLVTRRVRLGSRIAARFGVDPDRLRLMEDRVFEFAAAHPERILPMLACEAAYQIAAVFEIWIALALITGSSPSLVAALALEYVNRTITIVFQFVPMWLGVDEAGTGFVTAALGIGPAAGVSLALARKARIALWTATGLALWWTPSSRASASGRLPAPASPRRTPRETAPAATTSRAPRL